MVAFLLGTRTLHEDRGVVDHVRMYGHGLPIRQHVNSDVHLISTLGRTIGRSIREAPHQFEMNRQCVHSSRCIETVPLGDRVFASIQRHHKQPMS